jgi:hypothetical protein
MCPSTHDCCWQDPENGSSATLGICVKKGNCDFKRGIPKKGCKDPKNKLKVEEDSVESIQADSKEGYDDCGCFWNKRKVIIVLLLLILLVFVIFGLGNKKLKKNL